METQAGGMTAPRADLPTLADVRAARERIAPYVRRTPVMEDGGIAFKLELLQVTGSFKPRGAFNAALQLDPAARERGIVAVSSGNHARAVAHVGRRLGIRATVVLPGSTPPHIIEIVRAEGAEVVVTPTIAEAFEEVERRRNAGQNLIHPFDGPAVIAGQGTIGLELLEDVPALRTLIVSIGGGGLICGVAAVVKALKPEVRVFGVETEGADAMRRALDAGKPLTLPAVTSIARGLGAPYVTPRTLYGVQQLVDDVVVVPDAEAVHAIVALQRRIKILAEPAASCCVAALDSGRIQADADGTTALLVCGGNITLDEIAAWRAEFGDGAGA